MKITIGHLFYDILNLYGESGNILALKYALEKQGIDVEVKEISLNDNLYLGDLDLVYMGAGTETNQILALEYLKKYLPHISQEVLSGKFFLVTGNAVELFGTHIQDGESKIETLGIFHYYTERTKERRVSECVTIRDGFPMTKPEHGSAPIRDIPFPAFLWKCRRHSRRNTCITAHQTGFCLQFLPRD